MSGPSPGMAIMLIMLGVAIALLTAWNDQRAIDARQACRVGGGMVLEVEGGRGFVCLPALREDSKI